MSRPSVIEHLHALARLAGATADSCATEVEDAAEIARTALAAGRTLFFCGNGGSAADAQHLAAEYVVRFARKRRALPALALTVDSSVLTAGGNDLGFSEIFARQIDALGRPGDVVFLHSTSGVSANLLRAAEAARARGLKTIALLARDGGLLREAVDLPIVVPTESTAHAQEMHLALGHAICDIVDDAFEDDLPARIEELRRMEKAQTLWYRALAARAGERGDAVASERFNGLHADEQHHLSRLTARLLEWGLVPADLRSVTAPGPPADRPDDAIRRREDAEVAAYEALLTCDLDAETRAVADEILESERHHARTLDGKWMPA